MFLRAGTTPISEKTLENAESNVNFSCGFAAIPGIAPESCSENCGFRIDQVVRGHSENGISYSENGISNSESCSENTPELSESSENGPFTPRAFFLKSGWSPGFWYVFPNPAIPLGFSRSRQVIGSWKEVVRFYSQTTGYESRNWASADLLQQCLPLWHKIITSGKRGGVQKSMGHKVPWKTGMLICRLVLLDHSFSRRKKQFHLPVTSRPPIWQLAFRSFISLELRDPWNGGPFRNAPLLTKNDSQIIIFWEFANFTRNF